MQPVGQEKGQKGDVDGCFLVAILSLHCYGGAFAMERRKKEGAMREFLFGDRHHLFKLSFLEMLL
jgi:hypothetical protein